MEQYSKQEAIAALEQQAPSVRKAVIVDGYLTEIWWVWSTDKRGRRTQQAFLKRLSDSEAK